MTYKHLLKISARHIPDIVVNPHYIVKHMNPCECFHLNNNIVGWRDTVSIEALKEVETSYNIILH